MILSNQVIRFFKPYGQKIVSDGKMMWIYIPNMNVVAEQDLKSNKGLFGPSTKTGLNRLFSKYHYRFMSKKQPEQLDDGTKAYTLLLKVWMHGNRTESIPVFCAI